MTKLPVVFIAGPFRGSTPWEVEQNIRVAEEWTLKVWEAGAVAICTHTMTRHFDGLLTDEVWLEGIREILTRCDAVFVVPYRDGVPESEGTNAEIALAVRRGIDVYGFGCHLKWRNLLDWIEQFKSEGRSEAKT